MKEIIVKAIVQFIMNNYELECVYDNGLSLTFSGEVTAGEGDDDDTYSFSVKIEEYPVDGQIETPFNSGYKFLYKEAETAKKALDTMKCPTVIQGGLYQQTTLVGSEVEDWEDLDDLSICECYFYVHFSDSADVSLTLPADMRCNGDSPSYVKPGDIWEISINKQGGAVCLRT